MDHPHEGEAVGLPGPKTLHHSLERVLASAKRRRVVALAAPGWNLCGQGAARRSVGGFVADKSLGEDLDGGCVFRTDEPHCCYPMG